MTARRRRAPLGALVVAAALAACGGGAGDDDTVALQIPSTTVPTSGATAPPAGGSGGQGGGANGDDSTGDGGSGGAGSAGGGGGAGGSGGGTTSGTPVPDANVPVGQFGPTYLRRDRSERIVLELHVASGAEPSGTAVAHVRSVLEQVSGKPVEVASGADPGAGEAWTAASLRAAADAGPTLQGSGRAVLRLLFVHGTFDGNDGVLGVAVRGDVAAVFMDRVAAATGLLGDQAAIEASVTTHEVGHLLGLVDLVVRTGRGDPEHPGHSTSQGSVMYWAVESDLISSLLGAAPPRDFDADDLAELAAIAGG